MYILNVVFFVLIVFIGVKFVVMFLRNIKCVRLRVYCVFIVKVRIWIGLFILMWMNFFVLRFLLNSFCWVCLLVLFVFEFFFVKVFVLRIILGWILRLFIVRCV